jgi:SOS-response transcriptional repressor LexA
MTPRQLEVFLVIDEWWKKYGFSPSIDDIMMVLGAKGRGNIHRICNRLVEIGAVRKMDRKQRTLRPQGVKFRKIQT